MKDLKSIFDAAGVDVALPTICSCGTGVTASIVAHAMYQLNASSQLSIYDGSWTEWAALTEMQKACLGPLG